MKQKKIGILGCLMHVGDHVQTYLTHEGSRWRFANVRRAVSFALYTFIFALSALLSSCSDKDIKDPADLENPDSSYLHTKYYMALNFYAPNEATTRSETNSNGQTGILDNGFTEENKINTINLYFYDATQDSSNKGKLVLTLQIDASNVASGTINTEEAPYTVTTPISMEQFRGLLGKKLNVYALVNLSSFTPDNTTSKTEEEKFLDGHFSETNNQFIGRSGYTRPFYKDNKNGMPCPMANYENFTIDLTQFMAGSEPTDVELIQAIKDLFTGTYSDGWAWNASTNKNPFTTSGTLNLERMVARLDYKAGSSNNVYTLRACESSVSSANSSNGGVYLKVKSLHLFNASKDAYTFRHTAAGNNTAAEYNENNEYTISVFGKENNNSNYGKQKPESEVENDLDWSYRWIADYDWTTKRSVTITDNLLKSSNYFFNQPDVDSNKRWYIPQYDVAEGKEFVGLSSVEELCSWLNIDNSHSTLAGGYSPWYYVMENTVPATENMGTALSTGVAFEVVLCDADGKEYISDGSEVRITRTDDQYYQVLDFIKTGTSSDGKDQGYYSLTYKYLIEHNKMAKTEDNYPPMYLGVVRNNIYQLCLTGINNLPDPHEPDNFYLSVEIKVLAWARRDINVTF